MTIGKLAVIGGGQMGRALVGGMLRNGVAKSADVTVVDLDPHCRRWWTENHQEVTATDGLIAAVGSAEIVILAVKPNVIEKVIQQGGDAWQGKLVVSIAAGIGLSSLCRSLGHHRVVRVMPNTPSLVGEGASAYCGTDATTESDLEGIHTILEAVGMAVRVDEKQMDAVTGLSGSGPAYICMVIEALADGGVQAGLARPMAMALATQTVLGTATLVRDTGQHPGQLKDAVASPGGTTIAAIAALEQNGLRNALISAVAASAKRSGELG